MNFRSTASIPSRGSDSGRSDYAGDAVSCEPTALNKSWWARSTMSSSDRVRTNMICACASTSSREGILLCNNASSSELWHLAWLSASRNADSSDECNADDTVRAIRSGLNRATSCSAARLTTREPSLCSLRSTSAGGLLKSQTMPTRDNAFKT